MEGQREINQAVQPKIRGIRNNEVNVKEMWRQLNQMRRNPHQFYSLISNRKQYYNKQGMFFSPFHPQRSIQTSEGRQSLNQLLQELVNIQPLNPIAYNNDMNSVADDVARQYQICLSTSTQFQLNGKELRQMLGKSQKYIFPHPISCVIGVGFRDTFQPLISLLIDDGVPSRKNRRIMLSNKYQVCGIGAVPSSDPSLLCAAFLFTQSVIPTSKIPS